MPTDLTLPKPPINSGPPGQTAYNQQLQQRTLQQNLTKVGGKNIVPDVAGASGSASVTTKTYEILHQQHANRQFDGGRRRTKRRKSRQNKKSKKLRKKIRR